MYVCVYVAHMYSFNSGFPAKQTVFFTVASGNPAQCPVSGRCSAIVGWMLERETLLAPYAVARIDFRFKFSSLNCQS